MTRPPPPEFRGSLEQNQIDTKKLRRSVQPWHMDLYHYVTSSQGSLVVLAILFATAFAFPAWIVPVWLVSLVIGVTTVLVPRNARQTLPLRLPKADLPDAIDHGDPKPGRSAYNKARGTYLFGRSFTHGRKEVWASMSDVLTHILVVGGTGAGKTETLMSMAYQNLALGSGYAYVDPKGSPKAAAQHWYMLRSLGRDDSSLVINFAVGEDKLVKSPFWRTNTMQPFAFGKAEKLKEIPLSLMAGAGGSGNDANAVFSSNGKTLVTALCYGLTDLRDAGVIPFSINDMREFMNPDKFIEMVTEQHYRKHLKATTIEAIESFLKSMGWVPGEKDRTKWGDFARQYSYAQNYFQGVMSTMADTYRHIFNVPIGEVHMVDVILQRRALMVILPSLEKSKQEAQALGRVTLAQLRIATAVGLGGGEIMGTYDQIVSKSSTAARAAFQMILDEFPALVVDGFAEVFTQGRSLNISAVAAGQDWAGFKKANEAEAGQILSNTKLKFFMTGDDPLETKKLILELAGDATEIHTQGYSVKGVLNYMDNLAASAQKVARVDTRDIAAQIEGEWHLFFKDKIIRGEGFHAGGTPDDDDSEMPLFVHHKLMVAPPPAQEISLEMGTMRQLLDYWKSPADSDRPAFDLSCAQGFAPAAQIFEVLRLLPRGVRIPQVLKRPDSAVAALYVWFNDMPAFDAQTWVEMSSGLSSAAANAPAQALIPSGAARRMTAIASAAANSSTTSSIDALDQLDQLSEDGQDDADIPEHIDPMLLEEESAAEEIGADVEPIPGRKSGDLVVLMGAAGDRRTVPSTHEDDFLDGIDSTLFTQAIDSVVGAAGSVSTTIASMPGEDADDPDVPPNTPSSDASQIAGLLVQDTDPDANDLSNKIAALRKERAASKDAAGKTSVVRQDEHVLRQTVREGLSRPSYPPTPKPPLKDSESAKNELRAWMKNLKK